MTSALKHEPKCQIVSYDWLEDCLLKKKHLAERKYLMKNVVAVKKVQKEKLQQVNKMKMRKQGKKRTFFRLVSRALSSANSSLASKFTQSLSKAAHDLGTGMTRASTNC